MRIRRWVRIAGRHRRVVWEEPRLPPYVKINPDAGPATGGEGFQPGDISMGKIAEEFLKAGEDDEAG